MAGSKPKRINCFLCGNIWGSENEKNSLFGVPKNRLEDWRRALNNNDLKATSKLCDAHFSNDDIIKGRTIGGTFYLYGKMCLLKKEAVPTLFLCKEKPLRKPLQQLNTPILGNIPKKVSSNAVKELDCMPRPEPITCFIKGNTGEPIVDLNQEGSVDSVQQYSYSILNNVGDCETFPQCNISTANKPVNVYQMGTEPSTDYSSQHGITEQVVEDNTERIPCVATTDELMEICIEDRQSDVAQLHGDIHATLSANMDEHPVNHGDKPVKETITLNPEQRAEVEKSWNNILSYMPWLLGQSSDIEIKNLPVSSTDHKLENYTHKKKVINKKRKKTQMPARNTCHHCHAFVSATTIRLRGDNKISCTRCYHFVRKIEGLQQKNSLHKNKIKNLTRSLKSTKQKLERSVKTIEDLRAEVERCQEKICQLSKQQIDEQIKHLPTKSVTNLIGKQMKKNRVDSTQPGYQKNGIVASIFIESN